VDVKAEINFGRLKHSQKAIVQGLVNAAEMVKELASQLAPIDEGDLADSGEVEVVGSEDVLVSFGNGLPDLRAIAQEFGWEQDGETYPAQPYLIPAVNQIDVTKEVLEEYKRIVGLP
jgi:hypothetical protein